MFKTKEYTYPDLPEPPSWDLMIEDLNKARNSKKRDVLFGFQPKEIYHVDVIGPVDKDDVNMKKAMENQLHFNEVCDLIQRNEELLQKMEDLKTRREMLNQHSDNLQTSVERVKNQARTAIHK